MLDEKDGVRHESLGGLAGRVAKGTRMTKKAEIDLLIFDLDGTLIESNGISPTASI
jgi:hypothetical protein